jgi:hypothetical protein
MRFRAVTLNMEQDHKRWDLRRELIAEQLCTLTSSGRQAH